MDHTGEQATVAAAWDAEYLAGRYTTEPPLLFVDDIVAAARERGCRHGIYVGCGNGRNYARLVEGGLDLIGLDVSIAAIQQLAKRLPDRRARLIVGDIGCLRPETRLPLVVGIQVFQHGRAEQASAHIRAAQALVAPGGLFCVRVNADATDVLHDHRVSEQAVDGSYTVQYLDGPKKGLFIHFFSRRSLTALFADGFTPLMPMRLSVTQRDAPETGQWSQWEGIWCRTEV
jgi:SAM-dependent methyltransferase